MTVSVNLAFVLGRVGKDPDYRNNGHGSILKFSVATDEVYKDKITGEKKKNTDWHNVSAFNKIADVLKDIVSKGDLVMVNGAMKTNKVMENDGTYKTYFGIIAKNVRVISKSAHQVNGNLENLGNIKEEQNQNSEWDWSNLD